MLQSSTTSNIDPRNAMFETENFHSHLIDCPYNASCEDFSIKILWIARYDIDQASKCILPTALSWIRMCNNHDSNTILVRWLPIDSTFPMITLQHNKILYSLSPITV